MTIKGPPETITPIVTTALAAVVPKPAIICGWRELVAEVRRSRAQLWRDVRKGSFPAPIELGPNSVGWIREEVEEWQRTRPRRTYSAAKAA